MQTDAKILLFDLETSGLKGDFGTLYTFGYMWYGEKKPHTISVLDVGSKPCKCCKRVDPTADGPVVSEAYKILEQADMLIGWYSGPWRFDWPFFNTRMIQLGLPPLPDTPHLDLYSVAKRNFAMTSNRLANWQEFLNLPVAKTLLKKGVWRRASAGHVEEIEYINDHCRKDVLVLNGVYTRLRPYCNQHPRVGGRDGCRVCGGAVISQGMRVTTTLGPRNRYQCTECGHWETRAAKGKK